MTPCSRPSSASGRSSRRPRGARAPRSSACRSAARVSKTVARQRTAAELRGLLAAAFKGREPTTEEMRLARILSLLPIQEGEDWRIVPAVTKLAAMAHVVPKTKNLAAFRPIGLGQWERQRKRLIAA